MTTPRHPFVRPLLWALLVFFASPAPAADTLEAQRQDFRAARKALLSGQMARYEALRERLYGYPIAYYLDYAYLSSRLSGRREPIMRFLQEHEGWPLAEVLRTRWLTWLARRSSWDTFLAAYRPQSSADLRCALVSARLHAGAADDVMGAIRDLWLVGHSQPKLCDPLFTRLYKSPLLTPELLWQRIRLAMAEGNTSLAGYLARKLPAADEAWVTLWRQVHADPARHLRDRRLQQDRPAARELVRHGLARLARKDAERAADAWSDASRVYRFTDQERAAITKHIAMAAAAQGSAIAVAWLNAVPRTLVDADVQRRQLEYALRSEDWNALERWTTEPAGTDMNALRWRYWRARALEQLGRGAAANELFQSLAQERDYYGFMAADRMGVAYSFGHRPSMVPPEAAARLEERAAFRRAREFLHHKLRSEARREWRHAIADLGTQELEVAAQLAHQWQWHDRTILTLGKAQAYDDLELRFPLPYRELLIAYANKRKLNPGFIFSIARSESAFMEDAVSPAGALGLMQVMPATGKQTAQRIGYGYKGDADLKHAKTNVMLGSAYLRFMVDRFQGNEMLATSAYNAGPHRVARWLPASHCLPADLWIDTIPFRETRRYTRNNAFYTAIYQWRMGLPVESLSSRLKPVPPRNGSAAECAALASHAVSPPAG